jgi:hypothetical protein
MSIKTVEGSSGSRITLVGAAISESFKLVIRGIKRMTFLMFASVTFAAWIFVVTASANVEEA